MGSRIIGRLPLLAVVATVFALVIATTAFAQSSSVDTYGGGAGKIQSQIAPGGAGQPTAESNDSSGSLPFTGLDLGLAAGGGLLLLGAGATMASLASRQGRPEDR